MSALAFDRVSARLGGRTALHDLSFALRPGELTAVVGPNGAGKSTLLRVAARLLRAEGVVRLGDRDLAAMSVEARAAALAYLPQERRPAWGLPALAIAALGAAGAPPEEAAKRGREALERVGLGGLGESGVFDMSGGERARVLLARVLAARAPLLLLDEPLAGLDPEAGLQAMSLFREEAARGAAVVAALHDLTSAAGCDRVLVLCEGRLAADGPPAEALAPAVLRAVFGLEASWVEGPHGPLLAARRAR